MDAYITSARPKDVAAEVDIAKRRGFTSFKLRSVDGGGMLDRERVGAARYAAGLQSVVEVEPAAVAQRR
jgi:L-alanine-DL-glutamate epimerase-like enolase superfamily enzyme